MSAAEEERAANGHPLRLLVVAGEASGDRHAAALIAALRRRVPDLSVTGVGGEAMRRAGARLLYDHRHLAVVGVTEVLAHLGHVRQAMRALVRCARDRSIDGVVLVDYPDFNMVLARRLRRARPSLPIVYYISPQVWAWRRRRARALARLVDRMLVILPFEQPLYERVGLPVEFVGHPLLDSAPAPEERDRLAARLGADADRPWIALLPGSRRAEVRRLLPAMLRAAALLAADGPFEFVVPAVASLDPTLYERLAAAAPRRLRGRVHVAAEPALSLLRAARAAVVCSGTATLEAAIAGTPEVVVYRTSWLTYNLGKLLVRIPDIALVNVVAGRRGVPELLQGQATPDRIAAALRPLAEEGAERARCLEFLDEVRARLGGPGASERAARALLETVAGDGGVGDTTIER